MPKSTKVKLRNRLTKKNKRSIPSNAHKSFEQHLVIEFLQILNMTKLYHWKTESYATHQATDELYTKLNANIDKFIEILLGKHGDRINLAAIKSISLTEVTSNIEFKKEMEKFKQCLVDLNDNSEMKKMTNFDLYNIRDEILGDINQFLYLITFK